MVSLLIYAFAIYWGQQIMAKRYVSMMKELNLTSLEMAFIVLGMAGLFNHMIVDLIGNFILVTFSGTGS